MKSMYEVKIDTDLPGVGIITVEVMASSDKEAHNTAVTLCHEKYKDEYKQSREQAARSRAIHRALKRRALSKQEIL